MIDKKIEIVSVGKLSGECNHSYLAIDWSKGTISDRSHTMNNKASHACYF
mgnify:CR=1|jgi:hypothetical protein